MKHFRNHIISLILILIVSISNSYNNKLLAQVPFTIYGKVIIQKGKMADTKIIIKKDGKKVDEFIPDKNGKFEFDLDFHADYILSFTKPDYVTKKIEVNTNLPADLQVTYGWDPYELQVYLFKKQKDVDIYVFTQPVGKILYNPKTDDFSYDKDYHKLIRKKIEAVEKELATKGEEEARNEEVDAYKKEQEAIAAKLKEENDAKLAQLKAEAEATRLAEAEKKKQQEAENLKRIEKLKAEAEKKKLADQEEKRKREEEFQKQKIEQEALAKKEAEDRARLDAQKKAEIDAKLKAESEAARLAEENKLKKEAEDKAKRLAQLKVETEATNLAEEKRKKQEQEEREKKLAQLKSETDSLKLVEEENRKRQEEENSKKIAKLKAEAEANRLAEEKRKHDESIANNKLIEEERKKANASALAAQYPNRKNTEIIDKGNRTVVKTVIKDKDEIKIFLKVSYKWGGIYYFMVEENKEPRNISRAFYYVSTNS